MDNSERQFEADLKQHFGQEGTYDARKGEALISTVTEHYRRGLRKVERILCVSLYADVFLAMLLAALFLRTSDTKAQIAFGILFLLVIETSILMKLWYWIVNAKIGILKDLKLLRIEAGGPGNPENLHLSAFRGCSKWEGRAWQIGLYAIIAVMWWQFYSPGHARVQWNMDPEPKAVGAEYTSVLDASGREKGESRLSIPNRDLFPMETFSYFSGLCLSKQVVQDFAGHTLHATSQPAGPNLNWTIKLAEPVLPGRRLFLKTQVENPRAATKEGRVWTYRNTIEWGSAAQYSYKITLPNDAEVIEAKPKPASQGRENGRPVLWFKGTGYLDHGFEIVIKYHFPAKTRGAGPH